MIAGGGSARQCHSRHTQGQAMETLQEVVEISSSLSSSLDWITALVIWGSLWPLFFKSFRRSAGVSFSTRYMDTVCCASLFGLQLTLTWFRQDLVFSLQREVIMSGLGGLFASMLGLFAGTGLGLGRGQILLLTLRQRFLGKSSS